MSITTEQNAGTSPAPGSDETRTEPAVITRLRNLEETTDARITLPQLQAIRDGLTQIRPLAEIADAADLEPEAVFDWIAALGTWCTHVWGGANATISSALTEGQLMLLQVANDTDRSVTIPEGFERRAGGKRDISKALAAIVVHAPSDDALARYLNRLYPAELSVLSFAQVAFVHRAAQLGRLDDLEAVNEGNVALAKLFVAAYDLLDVALRTAKDAVTRLAAADVSDLGALRSAIAAARFLGERRMDKLARTVDMAERSKTGTGPALLAKELRFFAREVAAAPHIWQPASIAALTDGQVQRIAAVAGLHIEGSTRAEEAEIRRRLADLGLAADADRLVPDGLRAEQAGCAEEFWEAMARRADGDPEWAAELQLALAG